MITALRLGTEDIHVLCASSPGTLSRWRGRDMEGLALELARVSSQESPCSNIGFRLLVTPDMLGSLLVSLNPQPYTLNPQT